jgi:hypothetical protein
LSSAEEREKSNQTKNSQNTRPVAFVGVGIYPDNNGNKTLNGSGYRDEMRNAKKAVKYYTSNLNFKFL